jgi:hypothetical protein
LKECNQFFPPGGVLQIPGYHSATTPSAASGSESKYKAPPIPEPDSDFGLLT